MHHDFLISTSRPLRPPQHRWARTPYASTNLVRTVYTCQGKYLQNAWRSARRSKRRRTPSARRQQEELLAGMIDIVRADPRPIGKGNWKSELLRGGDLGTRGAATTPVGVRRIGDRTNAGPAGGRHHKATIRVPRRSRAPVPLSGRGRGEFAKGGYDSAEEFEFGLDLVIDELVRYPAGSPRIPAWAA